MLQCSSENILYFYRNTSVNIRILCWVSSGCCRCSIPLLFQPDVREQMHESNAIARNVYSHISTQLQCIHVPNCTQMCQDKLIKPWNVTQTKRLAKLRKFQIIWAYNQILVAIDSIGNLRVFCSAAIFAMYICRVPRRSLVPPLRYDFKSLMESSSSGAIGRGRDSSREIYEINISDSEMLSKTNYTTSWIKMVFHHPRNIVLPSLLQNDHCC
jgi:hypothetical protein